MGTLFADSIRASSLNRLHQKGRTEDCIRPMHRANLPLAMWEPSTEDIMRLAGDFVSVESDPNRTFGLICL